MISKLSNSKKSTQAAPLPVMRSLQGGYILSLIVAVMMAGVSLAGLFFQAFFYPTEALRKAFVSNDMVNLIIGLPVLLGAMWLARSGRFVGLLLWPGGLFYVTYNFIAYAVALPGTIQFFFYLTLVVLSAYGVIVLLSRMDAAAIARRLHGAVFERFAGGVLAGLGVLIFLMNAGKVTNAQTVMTVPDMAVMIADTLVIPIWIVCGILLWRHRAPGYTMGLGLLFQASMLFLALLVFFALQPFLVAVPFPIVDFVVVFMMGLVCFVPFGLFLRGVLLKS